MVADFLPGGEATPWNIAVSLRESFVHPLFGDRYACVELFLPLLTIAPDLPGYLDIVAANAAPCLDHQRYCFGANVTWEPDTGQLAIHGQVRLWEQPHTVLVAQLRERLRDMIALVYMTSFRIWQLQLRRRVNEELSDPVVTETWTRMMELLGAAPRGE